MLDNIEATFEREPEGGQEASGQDALNEMKTKKTVDRFGKKINIDDTGKSMHDTEGWKSLETSMRILYHIIEAIGVRLYSFNLDRILNVVKRGVDHINRFVREISYFVIKGVFQASSQIIVD